MIFVLLLITILVAWVVLSNFQMNERDKCDFEKYFPKRAERIRAENARLMERVNELEEALSRHDAEIQLLRQEPSGTVNMTQQKGGEDDGSN